MSRAKSGEHGHSPTADIADRLHSAAIHLLRRLRREDDASGLPAPQLSALSVIVFAGPVSLGDLARAEQVRPPTITRVITALEEQGLVERKSSPNDGRITHVVATPKGSRLLQEGRRRRVASLSAAIGELPGTDQQLLERVLPVLERIVRRD
jgi:DNA-binding MarR family transcriptional regulator